MLSFAQKIKKTLYPLIMLFTKSTGKGTIVTNEGNNQPVTPFFDLQATLNNGKPFSFSQLKGKKALLVNTASDCGFTGQYAELQALYKQFENKLTIIGFPANDFKDQEKSNDEAIADFCQVNYGVTFPLIQKTVVVNNAAQHEVFNWLSHKGKNGWLDHQPDWNFSKYLVDENGVLTHYFGPAVSPKDEIVVSAIRK